MFMCETGLIFSQIRNNVENYQDHVSYRLTKMRGAENSFEREWYEMCRSGFLKYNFQLRLGSAPPLSLIDSNYALFVQRDDWRIRFISQYQRDIWFRVHSSGKNRQVALWKV